MNAPDDEFDDFLRRRKPMFGRAGDDLEPPLELDRAVLRQAREAIESRPSHRMFRAPSWGMPVALAATLVLAFTIILRVGTPRPAPRAEVAVQNVSRQIEIPADAAAAAPAPPPAPALAARVEERTAEPVAESAASDSAVVDLGIVADRRAAAPAPAAAAAAPSAVRPDFRRDAKTWLAEIDRLRASGDTARADAELAEYKREFRAYAGAPDR